MRVRRFYVMTAKKAERLGLGPLRSYGYVVQIVPPVVTFSDGEDVEGIGWCPMPRRKNVQHFSCWCKHKSVAVKHAETLTKAEAKGRGYYRTYPEGVTA